MGSLLSIVVKSTQEKMHSNLKKILKQMARKNTPESLEDRLSSHEDSITSGIVRNNENTDSIVTKDKQSPIAIPSAESFEFLSNEEESNELDLSDCFVW